MEHRRLGEKGPEVSALGLGTMGMSPGLYGGVDDEESVATINRAIDLGIDFLDTANVYGGGGNERLVGRAIKGRRDEVILATKVGVVTDENGNMGANGKPEYVREQLEGSLQRLGVDHVDLYYLHRVDRDTPIEETVGATPAQLALAWVLSRGEMIVPIFGTRRAKNVESNAEAADLQLTEDEIQELEALADRAAGERDPEFVRGLNQ